MLKTRGGRPRKDGVPTRGGNGALKRRYFRALNRAKSGEKLIAKYRNDFFNYLSYLEKKGHATCDKEAIKVRANIDKYLGEHIMAVKKTAKKSAETKAENLSKKYMGIIESLQAGEENTSYTLLPTSKAKINHRVKFLVEVDEEMSLCEYKK